VEVGGRLRFDEAGARVEGPVPGDFGIGSQTYALVSAAACLFLRGLDECPAVSAPTVLGQHRQLLHVGSLVVFEDVYEPDNGASLGLFRDQDVTRVRRSRPIGRSWLPSVGCKPVNEELVGGVLYLLDRCIVGRRCEADMRRHRKILRSEYGSVVQPVTAAAFLHEICG